MTQYIHNTETEITLYEENGEWGARYVDSTGSFPGVDTFKAPWREATQEEIDAYLLEQAQKAKTAELIEKFGDCEQVGFEYQGNTFCGKQDGVVNVDIVDGLPAGDPNEFTFRDIGGVVVDFETQEAWDLFKEEMHKRRNNVMVYYVEKKTEIADAATVAEVEAIVIDFTEA